MQTLTIIPECQITISHRDDGPIGTYEDLYRIGFVGTQKNIYMPEHQHGVGVVSIDQTSSESPPYGGDIVVTNQKNCTIVHQFADCVPFLCIDRKQKAFVFSHLGWRGLTMGGVHISILSLASQFHSKKEDMWVWIGPCIQRMSQRFSVPPVQTQLPVWDRAITKKEENKHSVWYIDMPAFVLSSCQQMGVDPTHVIDDGRDTYTQSDLFFSHTRYKETGKQKGNFAIGVQI